MPLSSVVKSFMMSISPQTSWILKISVISVLSSLTIFYLSRPSLLQDNYQQVYRVATQAVTGKKAAFVQGVVENEIDGPFDPSTLAALCDIQEWMPGLIFRCEAPKGGVAIVRNVFLNCVRFAIEAGATSFIIPEIVAPGNSRDKIHDDTSLPFEHFFDLEYFKQSLGGACPQIAFIAHINDLWDVPSTANPMRLNPSDLIKSEAAKDVITEPGAWYEAFLQHLATVHPKPMTAELPTIVSLQAPLLQFPLSYDEPRLVANFGKILRFRDDVRRLAGAVLYAMDRTHNLGIEAEKDGVRLGHFYGAHLRTQRDAKAAGWTSYELQSQHYLSHTRRAQLEVIYLASDDEGDVKAFTDDAAFTRIHVITKEWALNGTEFVQELNLLNALDWQQRTLVDYEVLLRGAAFGGTYESSFSWGVAMRRHVVVGGGTWVPIGGEGRNMPSAKRSIDKRRRALVESGKVVREEAKVNEEIGVDKVETQSFRDAMSTIYGPVGEGKVFADGMWP